MHTNQTCNGEIIKFAQHENLNQNFSERKEKKRKEVCKQVKQSSPITTPGEDLKFLFFDKEIFNVESVLKTSTNWSKKMAKSRSLKDYKKKKKKGADF